MKSSPTYRLMFKYGPPSDSIKADFWYKIYYKFIQINTNAERYHFLNANGELCICPIRHYLRRLYKLINNGLIKTYDYSKNDYTQLSVDEFELNILSSKEVDKLITLDDALKLVHQYIYNINIDLYIPYAAISILKETYCCIRHSKL